MKKIVTQEYTKAINVCDFCNVTEEEDRGSYFGYVGQTESKWVRISTSNGGDLLPNGLLLCRQCAEEKIVPMVLKKVIKSDGATKDGKAIE